MKTLWNDLLCGLLGHPGLWVAELDAATAKKYNAPFFSLSWTGFSSRRKPGDLIIGDVHIPMPWRCSRCRRTLAEIRDDYSIEPDWLKKLGW